MVTVLVASRTVPPLAMSAYDLTLALPWWARTARMAAVRVVLPWSMCPIVPTLTCGLVLVKVSLAIAACRLYGIPVVQWRESAQAAPHVNPSGPLQAGLPAAWGRPLGPTSRTPPDFGPQTQSCRWD